MPVAIASIWSMMSAIALDGVHGLLRRALDRRDLRADLLGGLGGLGGEVLHLGGHHREALAGLAGAGRLDGGVEGQQVGLARRCC